MHSGHEDTTNSFYHSNNHLLQTNQLKRQTKASDNLVMYRSAKPQNAAVILNQNELC